MTATDLTESNVQADIVNYLRTAGWHVSVFSQDRKTRAQLAGWPDVVAFRRGVTLLCECKRPGGKRRIKQVQFANALKPHLWSTLLYVCAEGVADVARVCGDSCI